MSQVVCELVVSFFVVVWFAMSFVDLFGVRACMRSCMCVQELAKNTKIHNNVYGSHVDVLSACYLFFIYIQELGSNQ